MNLRDSSVDAAVLRFSLPTRQLIDYRVTCCSAFAIMKYMVAVDFSHNAKQAVETVCQMMGMIFNTACA